MKARYYMLIGAICSYAFSALVQYSDPNWFTVPTSFFLFAGSFFAFLIAAIKVTEHTD